MCTFLWRLGTGHSVLPSLESSGWKAQNRHPCWEAQGFTQVTAFCVTFGCFHPFRPLLRKAGLQLEHGARQPDRTVGFSLRSAKACLVVEQPRVRPRRSCRQAWKGNKPSNVLENSRQKGSVEYLSRAEVSQTETFCTGVQRAWGKI